MKTLTSLVLAALALTAPGLAHAQSKSLNCIIDQLSPADRLKIGSSILAGEGGASPLIEGATSKCTLTNKPDEVVASVQYANATVTYEAGVAHLKELGAPNVVDAVWAKVEPAKRHEIALSLKDGTTPPAMLSDMQNQLPKGEDAFASQVTALMTLQAKAMMVLSEQAAG